MQVRVIPYISSCNEELALQCNIFVFKWALEKHSTHAYLNQIIFCILCDCNFSLFMLSVLLQCCFYGPVLERCCTGNSTAVKHTRSYNANVFFFCFFQYFSFGNLLAFQTLVFQSRNFPFESNEILGQTGHRNAVIL